MGVEYRRYLLPKQRSFRPTPEMLTNLVHALRRERWLLSPEAPELASLPFDTTTLYAHAKHAGFYIRQGEQEQPGPAENLGDYLTARQGQDLLLSWPVESLAAWGLRYPLESLPCDDEDAYYEFQLHVSQDYVYKCSEYIDPFDEPLFCGCGADLTYDLPFNQDPFGVGTRIAAKCPKCGTPFDPTDLPATARDLWTVDEYTLRGGLTYRFAVVIDCGKCFDETGRAFAVHLKQLVESTLGIATQEVEDAD